MFMAIIILENSFWGALWLNIGKNTQKDQIWSKLVEHCTLFCVYGSKFFTCVWYNSLNGKNNCSTYVCVYVRLGKICWGYFGSKN